MPLTRRAVLAVPAQLPLLARLAPTAPQRRLLTGNPLPPLVPRADWHPYARLADRSFWESLPAALRQSYVDAAAKNLNQPWPSLPASVFIDFARNGNRTRMENISFSRRIRLRLAALAECIENRGRFLDEILDGLWLICEESFWGVSAHIGAQKAGRGLADVSEPIVDLFAAETANTVAWIDYLLPAQLDALSPLLRPRLRQETKRRVLDPCFARDNFGWMGEDPTPEGSLNNWTPWICSNWIAAALLLEDDEARRAASVTKALRSVDRFLAIYPADGGCDEGPSYWGRAGASLFDCLELLHSATAGKADFYSEPLVREIGAYIYRAHISEDWYTNFADAPARVHPDPTLVFRYGQRIADANMTAHGAWLAARASASPKSDAMGRILDELSHHAELQAAAKTARPPLVREVTLPGIQVLIARQQAGSDRGFFLAAQGGHNAESHNHNDVGNFLVFHDGQPVLIDVGVETYTAKTFSNQRYSIWTMQSAWHNCPTINGEMQRAGRQFAARQFEATHSANASEVSLDLAAAYPAEAAVESYLRRLRFDRSAQSISLSDSWRLTRAANLELNFILAQEPKPAGPGHFLLPNGLHLRFDPAWQPAVDSHETTDARLRPAWGERVFRLRLTLNPPPASGRFELQIAKA